jgi:hypothetical protein
LARPETMCSLFLVTTSMTTFRCEPGHLVPQSYVVPEV